ncbi:MAG: hypothetical protein ONB16_01245 [candidate division KSB1 bacterium]|nr:hypothetical protein [candidate division KSB1 bacterium]MDZ7318649.1 hypothetical protein [candidate division KSB1 bacterium]MDZ7340028.1 hypothetical protein [candidate division KSB1 bacterium]
MNRRMMLVIGLAVIVCFLMGCAAHIHKVGTGAQSSQKVEARQWYALWGLVPINQVNTDQMAEGAKNYTIKTEQSALDVLINIFTGYVSVVSRTVTVTK